MPLGWYNTEDTRSLLGTKVIIRSTIIAERTQLNYIAFSEAPNVYQATKLSVSDLKVVPASSGSPLAFVDTPDFRSLNPFFKAKTPSAPPVQQEDPLSRTPPHLDTFKWFDNVIFELNGVFLLSPDAVDEDKRAKEIRYDVITSLAWCEFEKGLIVLDECRTQIRARFDLSEKEIEDAIASAMSCRVSPEMLFLATELSSTHNVYAIGNLPQPAFEGLKETIGPSSPFKHIFISSKLHDRLPHPAILSKTLNFTGLDPRRTLYIGSQIENITTARTFGFHSIKCGDYQECIQRALHICSDPVARAKAWLQSKAGELDLAISHGITVKDAFMQACILDTTDDKSLIYYDPDQHLFSRYYGSVPNGLPQHPPDVDSNSLAYSVYDHLDDARRQNVMDQMLQCVDSQGILQCYLSKDKVRIDILTCVNGLALFHEYGRGHQLAPTEDWIYRVLTTRAFRDGTHYYPSPDLFLYFVSRLLRKAPNLRSRFGPVLRDCVLERMEAGGDALALASRLIAAARCGVRNDDVLEKLLALQKEDGSWEAGVVYHFIRVSGVAWHQGFTVSLAVLAIEEWDYLR